MSENSSWLYLLIEVNRKIRTPKHQNTKKPEFYFVFCE